jgi:hypothetical protein
MKIPKNDRRYTILNRYFQNMSYPYKKQIFFYEDGTFLGCYIHFDTGHILSLRVLPKHFVSYQYQNMATMEYSCDRCWFNLEDMSENVNNYWQQATDDNWIPNPNSYILH